MHGFWKECKSAWAPGLPLTLCVISGKIHLLSGPQFTHLEWVIAKALSSSRALRFQVQGLSGPRGEGRLRAEADTPHLDSQAAAPS